MDALSHVLAANRVTGMVAMQLRARGGWGLATDSIEDCALLIVVQGSCWLRAAGHPPVQLVQGDVLMLPSGSAAALTSSRNGRAMPARELLSEHPRAEDGTVDLGGTDRWHVGFGRPRWRGRAARTGRGPQRRDRVGLDRHPVPSLGTPDWLSGTVAESTCAGCACAPVDEDTGLAPHFTSSDQAVEELTQEWGWYFAAFPARLDRGEELLCPGCTAAAGYVVTPRPPALSTGPGGGQRSKARSGRPVHDIVSNSSTGTRPRRRAD